MEFSAQAYGGSSINTICAAQNLSKGIVYHYFSTKDALYPAFGLCYMMTITYQTIGASRYGLFLSMIRQGLFHVPFILTLPKLPGITDIYLSQPAADVLTILACLLSIQSMKRIASRNMRAIQV